jgi:hypothetical protein
VACLTTHVGLTMEQAIASMPESHSTGGKLIPRCSPEAAARIAEAISREAAEAGHALVCRYAGETPAA